MAGLIPIPDQFQVGITGNLAIGYQINTFIVGTNVPFTTYSDYGLTITNTNPIILDGNGRANIYGDGQLDMVLEDAVGNQIFRATTSSYLPDGTISDVMLPVVGAQTLEAAQEAFGLPELEAQWAAGIMQTTGPTGVQGSIGPTGPQGPQGSAAGSGLNYQIFSAAGNYTWINPGTGSIGILQIWSDGGAGGADPGGGLGGAGGPGIYVCLGFLMSDLGGANVGGAIGAGGQYNGTFFGSNGTGCNFGPYISVAGGFGGNSSSGIDGGSGYITGIVGLNPVFLCGGFTTITTNPATGQSLGSAFGQPTLGQSPNTFVVPSYYGGTGGTTGSPNGQAPGGGGALGGSGGIGQIRVTVF